MQFHALLKSLALPPSLVLWLFLLGLLCWRWQHWSLGILIATWLLLFSLSLPIVTYYLARPLQDRFPPLEIPLKTKPHSAIVILSGGVIEHAAAYQTHGWPNDATLQRIVYAAYLYQQSHLPILVSGGNLYGHPLSDAEIMRNTLQSNLNTPVTWLETKSNNTQENAQYSIAILQKAGIHNLYLVTHAQHMPRAVLAFQDRGINIIAAPMGFVTHDEIINPWVPSFEALYHSSYALYEYLGLIWYHLRYSD